MTAQTSNFSGLLYYNPAGPGFNPIVSAYMAGPASINEGATATFNVVTWGIPDGPVYWWVSGLTNITTDRITPGLASQATVLNNRLTFTITVSANNATAAGAQSYTINFGKVQNTALASITVTVADTSQTPVPSGSFEFTGVQFQDITLDGNVSDWALDKTGTIEWWQKAASSNSFAGNFNGGILAQGNEGGTGGLDIFAAGGNIAMTLGGGGVMPYVVEPASTTTWTHVAISFAPNPDNLNVGKSRVYFNGVEQSINNNSVLLSNSTDPIRIGSRVPDANYQNFTGKITNIHISTANLYTGNFTPTIRTTATTGTVFLMNSNSPTTDISGRHTITGGIYTLSADVVNLRTATHSASNGGSSNVYIDTNPTNDAWAGSVPVGAQIISSVTGRFTVNSLGRDIVTNNWIFFVGGSPNFTAGETHTFIW